ncbi:unnamed protein product [Nezara viridula]|uniref:Ferritin n=1 Tax=Nezara viridula TaxID=85310 RepID=A0A9P0GXN3_NEZVI|nr:unnamed protein product [Nezara viridula]
MFSALKLVLRSDFYKCLTKLKPGYSIKLTRYSTGSDDDIKFNFNSECEEQINQQINQELYASYAYLTMAYHFEHPAVALPGFFTMYLFFSKEETEHATKLIEFQNKRGGNVHYNDIVALENCEWTPESSVIKAIELERSVTSNLLVLHEKGSKHNDCHLCNFVEDEYIQEQYTALKDLYTLLTKIKRLKDTIGIQIIDEHLYNKFKNKKI